MPTTRPTQTVTQPLSSIHAASIPGEVLGFENLVYSIFEFVNIMVETNRFRPVVRKALTDLIYYVIVYMQITEDQVGSRGSSRDLPHLA